MAMASGGTMLKRGPAVGDPENAKVSECDHGSQRQRQRGSNP